MRRFAARCTLALLAVGITLVAVEASLRVAGYAYNPMHVELDGIVTDWRAMHAFGDESFEWDVTLIWRPRAGVPPFNAEGYRGPICGPKRSAACRIVTIGDSNTLGWRDTEDAPGPNWPGYLAKELDPIPVEVVNAGVWGYSSYQSRQRLHEALELEPDVVIISAGGNDSHLVRVPDAEFAKIVYPNWVSRMRLGQVFLAARDGLHPAPVDGESLVTRVSVDAYKANLEAMIAESQSRGAVVVLLTRPYTMRWFGGKEPPMTSWTRRAPAYNAITVELAQQHGLPMIDAYEHFRELSTCWADESHFNEEGHRKLAEMLGEVLLPLLSSRAE